LDEKNINLNQEIYVYTHALALKVNEFQNVATSMDTDIKGALL